MMDANVVELSCCRSVLFQSPAFLRCSSLDSWEGIIDAATVMLRERRKVIWVAKRVHGVLSRGKGRFVNASKTELLPLD